MNTQTIKILLTSGATQEPIDDVRFLGNRSSGKLGALIAYAAAVGGHEVTLLLGEHAQPPAAHPRLSILPFTTTADLQAQLHALWPDYTLLIMAAAISDYTPKNNAIKGKITRGMSDILDVQATPDIVAGLSTTTSEHQRIIAFALEEAKNLQERALKKLSSKNVDAIVANPIQTMESDRIEAKVFCKDGAEHSPGECISKATFARWLISNLHEIVKLPNTEV
ncbi:MAG: phosphopantothenoylcysteine decarboxylase [Phycisphaerae bacterium]|nr:phosphopantothenoylcysteine decarboxylase [Phycisphaerae bacterium]